MGEGRRNDVKGGCTRTVSFPIEIRHRWSYLGQVPECIVRFTGRSIMYFSDDRPCLPTDLVGFPLHSAYATVIPLSVTLVSYQLSTTQSNCSLAHRACSVQVRNSHIHRLRSSSHKAPYHYHLRSPCPSPAFKGSISNCSRVIRPLPGRNSHIHRLCTSSHKALYRCHLRSPRPSLAVKGSISNCSRVIRPPPGRNSYIYRLCTSSHTQSSILMLPSQPSSFFSS
jgi:hypothetical protein